MAITQDIQQTLDVLKGIFQEGPSVVTPEIAKTLNVAAGLRMYNLEPAAKVLVPIFSPIRNKLPRVKGRGGSVEFKAVTEVDTSGQSGVAVEGVLANQVSTGLADVNTGYRSYGLSSDPVTFEAEWASEGFGTHPKELAIANLLKAVMRAEEKLILFGQGSPGQITTSGTTSWTFGGLVGNAPTPTLAGTTVSGTTGLTSTTTYYVKVTVVTGMGESLPSATASLAPGSGNNALQVTPVYPNGIPALKFNIYASTSSTGPFYYAGSTNGAPFNLTSIPSSGNQPPTTDNSGNTNAFNGIFAYLFSQGSGAYIAKLGAQLTIQAINTALQSMFDNAAADPSDMYVSSYESNTITKLVLGSGNWSPYFITVDNQNAATANYRVARFVNPITGTEIKITVHKYMPQGNILIMSHELPEWYVGSLIQAPQQMSMVQDYVQIDYPPTSSNPQWISEIRCFGALQMYIPAVNGAIVGISP